MFDFSTQTLLSILSSDAFNQDTYMSMQYLSLGQKFLSELIFWIKNFMDLNIFGTNIFGPIFLLTKESTSVLSWERARADSSFLLGVTQCLKRPCKYVISDINMLVYKVVMAGIIVLILYDWSHTPCSLWFISSFRFFKNDYYDVKKDFILA